MLNRRYYMKTTFITDNWPQLVKYMPPSTAPLPMQRTSEGTRIVGYCNNAAFSPGHWLDRSVLFDGSRRFVTDPDVPSGYFACGINMRGSLSEYLFACGTATGAGFGSTTGPSLSTTPKGVRPAWPARISMRRFEAGRKVPLLSCMTGWFDSATNEWTGP